MGILCVAISSGFEKKRLTKTTLRGKSTSERALSPDDLENADVGGERG